MNTFECVQIFKDVPIYGLFTTGLGGSLFLKISASSTPNSVILSHGNSRDGGAQTGWIPDDRMVHILNDQEIVVIKNRWDK